MIRGIIFDFDGLMVDTEGPAYESWMEIYREYGCELPLSRWALVLGGSGSEFDPCAYLAEHVGQELDAPAITARRWQRKLELVAGLPLLPGVAGYVDTAKRLGLKVAVASSAHRDWVTSHLDRLNTTAHFDAIVTADNVTRVKPDPEIYQAALAALALRPEEAIALEDAPNGVLAAKRAGIFCVAVPNAITGQLPLDHADLRITSLASMPLETLRETVAARRAGTGRAERVGP